METIASTYSPIPNERLSASYGTAEFLSRLAGTETVTIGGLQFPNQEFIMATLDGWQGEKLTNGIWGFAYPAITQVYNGSSAYLSDFDKGGVIKSAPEPANFIPKATGDGIIAPVVGLALQATRKVGGLWWSFDCWRCTQRIYHLTLRYPSDPEDCVLAGTHSRTPDINRPPPANDTFEYGYYTIEVDGVSIQSANGSKTFCKNYLAFGVPPPPTINLPLLT